MLLTDIARVANAAIERAQDAARAHVAPAAHVQRVGGAAAELMRLEGEFSHQGATCTVEWAHPLPDRARWVRNVFTAPERRNKGDATALMRSLMAQADALGMALVLEPDAHLSLIHI